MLLPYDAHNHVHMGQTLPYLLGGENLSDSIPGGNDPCQSLSTTITRPHVNLFTETLCGMAVMSTHPRDFETVIQMGKETDFRVLPCVGVHPWFLHEIAEDDWAMSISKETNLEAPRWILAMEKLLLQYENIPVGEIGLDGFHFDPDTRALTSPMEMQIQAFELQLSLAIQCNRPVSIHCVRAIGPLMATISKVQKLHKGKLPPSIYFHAFGGKATTATQLVKTYEKKNATRVFFGFAPIINFASLKTEAVIREVGLDRLVLETDHEDAAHVGPSMETGLQVISKLFGISQDQLIRQTNANSKTMYRIKDI